MMMLFPILLISRTIMACAPWPLATTAMSAAMPTMMPSAVSSERVLLRKMARSATFRIMKKVMGWRESGLCLKAIIIHHLKASWKNGTGSISAENCWMLALCRDNRYT